MAGATNTLADQTSETESEAGVVVKGQLLVTQSQLQKAPQPLWTEPPAGKKSI